MLASSLSGACSSEGGDEPAGPLVGTDGGVDAALASEAGTPGFDGGVTPGQDGAVVTTEPDASIDPPALHGALVAYASGGTNQIGMFSVDETTGAFNYNGNATAFGDNPSFLAINPTSTVLYAVNEVAPGEVGAYAIAPSTGALTFLNKVSSGGDGPPFVSVDRTGKFVFVANYNSGMISVIGTAADGHLTTTTDNRLAGQRAHMMVVDRTNRFVFVPCLGDDVIKQYRFDSATGKLTANTPPSVATKAGAGPRHIAFHPSASFVYGINESDSTMNAYSLDGATGTLTEIDSKSTLPDGVDPSGNTCAEVWVHPNGKYVFGSNRGHDSIVSFAIDAQGKLTLVGHTPVGGQTPRDFTLDPTGHFLYAANQGSGTLTSFTVDSAAGTLTAFGSPIAFAAPSFIGVVRLP